jgi:hypothetical protein
VYKVGTADVKLHLLFPSQSGRQGLGAGNFNPNPSAAVRRKLVSATVHGYSEDRRVRHSQTLKRQGVWVEWSDNAIPFDLSWENVIWKSSPHIVKFVLNASINWVRTPDLLKLWGYKAEANCPICPTELCTLHHIISGCTTALASGRYTWRHDSVLLCIKNAILPHIEAFNEDKRCVSIQPIEANFYAKGKQPPPKPKHSRPSILDGAKDWKPLFDLGDKLCFPVEIYETPERPDIVIWSPSAKRVILIELTVPAEEGMKAAQARKEAKYAPLVQHIKDNDWTPHLYTIEVGARGFVGRSVRQCMSKLGLGRNVKSALLKSLSLVAAKCSYAIYLAYANRTWDADRDLLALE